jgi:hypothetical protein
MIAAIGIIVGITIIIVIDMVIGDHALTGVCVGPGQGHATLVLGHPITSNGTDTYTGTGAIMKPTQHITMRLSAIALQTF